MQYAVNGIIINYTGNSNNVTVEKCKTRYNSNDGLAISGNNYSGATVHPLIKDNTISNNFYGFELYDYAKPTITGNRIENNTNAGIFGDTNCNAKIEYNYITNNGSHGLWFIISCNADVHRNTIKSNGTRGITCAINSNVLACGANTDTTKGRNEIANNSGVGIYASTSSPNFGKDLAAFYGNNWIHDNTSYEAQQASGGYQIHARRCYWNGQQSNVAGTVYTTPVLSSAPSPVGWGRSTNYDPTYLKGFKPGMIAELPPADSHHNTAMRLTVNAGTNGTLAGWTEELKAAINQGLSTGDWSKASEVVAALHRELQEARVPEVDFALVNTYANDLAVAASIRKMLALVLMENDLVASKTSDALTKLTAFTQSNSENAAELLANAGVIHLYRLNDLAATQTILSQLQTMAKNGDPVAVELVEAFNIILPRYQRQQAIIPQRGGLEKPVVASLKTPTLPKVPALAQNYPNPFNPETTIRFHLHERQKVRLVIYDLAGHRVRTLVDGELVAGEQAMTWDGRDHNGKTVASGVYFYELLVGNKVERRKMTLIR